MEIASKRTFVAAIFAAIASAETDSYDLQGAVQKNLKWIRPPIFGNDFHDIESFFKEKPLEDHIKSDENAGLEFHGDTNYVDGEGNYHINSDGGDTHYVDGEGSYHTNTDGDNFISNEKIDELTHGRINSRGSVDDQPHGYHI